MLGTTQTAARCNQIELADIGDGRRAIGSGRDPPIGGGLTNGAALRTCAYDDEPNLVAARGDARQYRAHEPFETLAAYQPADENQ